MIRRLRVLLAHSPGGARVLETVESIVTGIRWLLWGLAELARVLRERFWWRAKKID